MKWSNRVYQPMRFAESGFLIIQSWYDTMYFFNISITVVLKSTSKNWLLALTEVVLLFTATVHMISNEASYMLNKDYLFSFVIDPIYINSPKSGLGGKSTI